MTETHGSQITFSEAFLASEALISTDFKTDTLVAKRRRRLLVTASMFVPVLEDNQVIDDATMVGGEEAIKLYEAQWNQLFLISSYLNNGMVVQLRR